MSHHSSSSGETGLDLSRFRKLPLALIVAGGGLSLVGSIFAPKQFGFSYLTAYMFFLSLVLGSLFLVIMHHLFDSQWMVPLRRVWEHIACLAPIMGLLLVPIVLNVLFAGKESAIYMWTNSDPHTDHALHTKQIMFNRTAFVVMWLVIFGIWTFLTWSFRKWSLEQDKTGGARPTFAMRKLAAAGIFVFAFTLTLGAFYWMKAVDHHFFSTMYGVYYFAGSVWVTLATSYLLAIVLKRSGPLSEVVHGKTIHDSGVLLFAFTVFYAYIHFSQYFLIWNAALPEETFWYVNREQGSWAGVSLMLIFGHFLLPFLVLLRIDAKLSLAVMVPTCVWAWMMHYMDMAFNIKPVLNPNGFSVHWLDVTTFAFFAGVLSYVFIKWFAAHPPFPQRDPRIAETLGVYVPTTPAAQHGGHK